MLSNRNEKRFTAFFCNSSHCLVLSDGTLTAEFYILQGSGLTRSLEIKGEIKDLAMPLSITSGRHAKTL